VSRDQLLIERLKLYSDVNPLLSITFSASLPAPIDFDVAVLPSSLMLDPIFPKTETIHRFRAAACALICYGPVEMLPGCFLAGCDDYLKVPWPPEELEWRVIRLCREIRSEFRFSWGSFEIGSLELRSSIGMCRLSAQEQSILRMLVANTGEAVSREALYYGIWGRPTEAESRAVDMHIASLRKKLRELFPESRSPIRSIRGVGYLLVD
jgi:DNA-binding winged helix-turn-helix (wHTH) protein